MYNFFKKKDKSEIENPLVKIAALLVHVARIDENYTKKEKEIVRKAMIELSSKNEKIEEILSKAEEIEKNSNQILEFTKEVKNMDKENKIKIIENLWRIIYSNKKADIYETSLMRRLAGLLYIDSKIMGDIKDKIKKESSNDLHSK